jgi:ABC-type uncharacterized transport system ATPase subunit
MEQDIQEYLDEVLDEEFNTVLDDGSSHELAQLFIRYIQLIHQGKLADVEQELQLQNATAPAVQMSVRNKNENDLSSSSDDDDDDDDNGDDNEMREEQSSTQSKSQAMDVDEEGWWWRKKIIVFALVILEVIKSNNLSEKNKKLEFLFFSAI